MMKYAIVVLCLFAVSTNAVPASKALEIFGIVSPVEPCGGQGRALQLRISGCEGAPPCDFYEFQQVDIEADFIVLESCSDATFTLTAETALGHLPVAEGSLGSLTAGVTYTARQSVVPSSFLVGQQFPIRGDIKCGTVLEVCVKVGVRVIRP